ncbi:MAG: MerR family transcriptional regulator [Bacillota bacterium]|nr:MerR family transcriptional regulator [Bacillota bacterium]
MNTNEVAKLLGVSQSTIQRWVKQLELPMEKNDRGHYLFSPEDIELIKGIQVQIQNGVLIQDITPLHEKKARKGTIKSSENLKNVETLTSKIFFLEKKLNEKADSVVSYQLLQHRNELEELQNQVNLLLERLETLETLVKPSEAFEPPLLLEQPKPSKKPKKKNIVSSLFGF